MGTFNGAIDGAAAIPPAEPLPRLATTAAAVAVAPLPPLLRPRCVCAQMRSGRVLNGAIDNNDVYNDASACGTVAALSFPSF